MNGSLYMPGDSWLHRMPAGVKLLGLALAGTGLFLVHSPAWLGGAMIGALALARACGAGPGVLWGQLRGIFWFMLALGVYTGWVQGLEQAAEMLLRLAALVIASLAVTLTTPMLAMMGVVERLLAPLGAMGWVNPERVALTVGLTLRMIPELTAQWHEIREAQAARGIAAHPARLIVPMLVRTIQRANEVAEAIDARGA